MKKIITPLLLICSGVSIAQASSDSDLFTANSFRQSTSTSSQNSTYQAVQASYLSNIYMANNMFDNRFHNRIGERNHLKNFDESKHGTSLWVLGRGGFTDIKAGDSAIDNHANYYAVQVGADLISWDEESSFHMGIMTGHASSRNTATTATNVSVDSHVNGSMYGVYMSWSENQAVRRGLYVNTSISFNDYKGHLDNDGSDEYILRGVIATIESGYNVEVGKLGQYIVLVEPQAQLTYQGVKAHDFTDEYGYSVKGNFGNYQSRIGVRGALQFDEPREGEAAAQIFAELNWIHNTHSYGVTSTMDNEEYLLNQDSIKNLGELVFGLEGYVVPNFFVWTQLVGQKGQNDYKNVSIALGVQYYF